MRIKLKGLCDDCIHNGIDCIHFVNIEAGSSLEGTCTRCDEYKSKGKVSGNGK